MFQIKSSIKFYLILVSNVCRRYLKNVSACHMLMPIFLHQKEIWYYMLWFDSHIYLWRFNFSSQVINFFFSNRMNLHKNETLISNFNDLKLALLIWKWSCTATGAGSQLCATAVWDFLNISVIPTGTLEYVDRGDSFSVCFHVICVFCLKHKQLSLVSNSQLNHVYL